MGRSVFFEFDRTTIEIARLERLLRQLPYFSGESQILRHGVFVVSFDYSTEPTKKLETEFVAQIMLREFGLELYAFWSDASDELHQILKSRLPSQGVDLKEVW